MEKLKHPYEMFGIECGQGWKDLYQPIFDWIENYNNEHTDDPIIIEQVKEKFGGLRFYVDRYPNELFELIRKAEHESYNVCEHCGTRKNVGVTVDGWYETKCLKCLQKQLSNGSYRAIRKWRRSDNQKLFEVTKDSVKEIKQDK